MDKQQLIELFGNDYPRKESTKKRLFDRLSLFPDALNVYKDCLGNLSHLERFTGEKMKDLIKMVKENNKLGYQLSAICGTNWLIRKLFKWQYLFFLMVMSAVCIKEIYLTLDVDTRILSALLYLVMLGAPFAKLRLGSEIIFMKLMIRNTFLAIIFTAALAKPIQERESLFWIFATIISFVVYRLANWLQTKLFHHYLFVRVLNK